MRLGGIQVHEGDDRPAARDVNAGARLDAFLVEGELDDPSAGRFGLCRTPVGELASSRRDPMGINLQVWNAFLGQCFLVFLIIEGLKIFPVIARASRGSLIYKLQLNVAVNVVFAVLVRGTGNDMFLGTGALPVVLSVVTGSLDTAGLHRLKKAFERRSPSNHLWEAKQRPSA